MNRIAIAFLALATSCATATPSTLMFPRAIVTVDNVKAAAETEAYLSESYKTLPGVGTPWFRVLSGSSRVLVVAAHATAQVREGKMKDPDAGTGALATALHDLGNATVIYTTMASPSDPNFYDENEFKQALKVLVEHLSAVLSTCDTRTRLTRREFVIASGHHSRSRTTRASA